VHVARTKRDAVVQKTRNVVQIPPHILTKRKKKLTLILIILVIIYPFLTLFYSDSDAAEHDDEERLDFEKSGVVLPRRQTKKTEEERKNAVGYDIPGTQKVYLKVTTFISHSNIKTFGCSHNQSDSEYMAGLLTSYGYSVTEKFDENSDAYIVNSCTVKGPSESGFMNLVTKAKFVTNLNLLLIIMLELLVNLL
jgi:hypothetical protein